MRQGRRSPPWASSPTRRAHNRSARARNRAQVRRTAAGRRTWKGVGREETGDSGTRQRPARSRTRPRRVLPSSAPVHATREAHVTRLRLLCAVLTLASVSAFATPPYERPAGIAGDREPLIVAGYRALFTCSAHFFAGRPLDDIRRVELVDVEGLGYPPPAIDERTRTVTATDTSGQIVRIAAFRDTMGCTLLPPQWSRRDIPKLPYVAYPPAPDLSGRPFPEGERVDLPPDGIANGFEALGPVLDRAFDGRSDANPDGAVTTAVIVAVDGRIVAERYRPGFGVYSGYRTWSTSKSLVGALIGIAAGHGILDPDASADIPEWDYPGDPRQAITYRHLLRMSSGLQSGGPNTNAIYFGGQDVVSAATTTPLEVAPGTRWKYANNDTLLLLRALRHRLDDDLRYLRFPYDELLHPIGMYHTRMEIDHLGNFVGSSQTYTTARDLTRFGLLIANDGVWNRRRLLPEGWVEFLRTPAPTRPPAKGEWGYGAQFWLLDQMPGIPPGTFTTAGNKGQFVTIVPGRGLVVVRTGVDPDGTRFEQHRLVAEVVSALGR
ncbi:MAG: serine hydrolase [Betaproteobacteria bacterium]|nr:serine hydrolase [Betaproteobacteria bacterium]